ncbi:TPA: hypothetical protein ACN37F_002483 [Vibrio parahaemolyticus]|nr:hypothetical protein [Vibrio parahaemolyticus]MDF4969557.1 hypothetical protein [Vibrio parahaemolyticus]HCH1528231.1 hypothetical protein [Vibrio parahaemolyticus]
MRATIYNEQSKQVIAEMAQQQNKSISYIINQLVYKAISQQEETETHAGNEVR